MNSTRKIRTATLTIAGAALGLLSLTSAAAAATTDAAATQLLTKYNCQACHTVDKKVVGPAYKEVAAKYAGDSTALAKLGGPMLTQTTGVAGRRASTRRVVSSSERLAGSSRTASTVSSLSSSTGSCPTSSTTCTIRSRTSGWFSRIRIRATRSSSGADARARKAFSMKTV